MLFKEKGELVSDNKNKFFINITKSLNLKEDQVSSPVTFEELFEVLMVLKPHLWEMFLQTCLKLH